MSVDNLDYTGDNSHTIPLRKGREMPKTKTEELKDWQTAFRKEFDAFKKEEFTPLVSQVSKSKSLLKDIAVAVGAEVPEDYDDDYYVPTN